VALIWKTNRPRRGKVLAALFIFYGGAHLLAAAFLWLIVLALAGEGYSGQLREPKTLALFGSPLLAAALPLLSGYALLRGRRWAEGAVWLTCLAVLLVNFIVLTQITKPELSARREIFAVLYGGASAALCLYGIWFVRKGRAA
jgi:hypothetical protein